MRAGAELGLSVELVRVVDGDVPPLAPAATLPNGALVVEADPAVAAEAACRSVTGGRDLTIVEIGAGSLAQLGSLHFDAVLVGVGPFASDEWRAASAIRALPGGLGGAAWALGLGRGGGVSDARRLERSMADIPGDGTSRAIRVLPGCVPAIRRGEADALVGGAPSRRVLQSGIALLAALATVCLGTREGADTADAWVRLAEAATDTVPPDGRDEIEALRKLADDLERISAGSAPTPEDLAAAPVLDRWAADVRIARNLVGVVAGHPTLTLDESMPSLVGVLVYHLAMTGVLDLNDFERGLRECINPDMRMEDSTGFAFAKLADFTAFYRKDPLFGSRYQSAGTASTSEG